MSAVASRSWSGAPKRRAFGWVLLATAMACHGATVPIGPGRTLGKARLGRLMQTVELSANPVRSGSTISIPAILYNRGPDTVRAFSGYGCRVDLLDTDLQLGANECLLPTRMVSLPPGDSVVAGLGGVVMSPPGTYTVRVRQAFDAHQLWAEITAVVLPS